MKTKSKKTIIIVMAVVVIAVIVWLVFFRKKEWEKILDNLDIDSVVKEQIRAKARDLDSDPTTRQQLQAEAVDYGQPYAKWLIMSAAMKLGYPVQQNYFGQIIINPKD